MDTVAKEQWALAVLTARFDCSQQKFFQAEYGRRRRSPAVALALCLTLGAFGAHEFYLGRLTSAVLRLLFCWTLIPALLALVDSLYLTRRVHRYNTSMAHTLAEIVVESFAAVRSRPDEDNSELASWPFGMARTLEPVAPQRWSGSHPTQTLADERVPAAATLATASDTVPLTLEPAPEQDTPRRSGPSGPVTERSAQFSRREWTRLSPTLDAMLDDLSALADDAESRRTAQTAATAAPPAALDESTQPMLRAVAPRKSRVTRDNSMSANEPQPAIMGAGVATAVIDAPPPPPTPRAPKRIQRVTVRKVAMVDGQPVAEARATRQVDISPWDEDVEARIELAKAEARAEAMRKLSLLFPAGSVVTDS